ncbi:glycosyltransferase [Bacteroidota bacterium]
MKILQFIYSLAPGGAERFVVDLANELARNNEIILYVLRDEEIDNYGFYKPDVNGNVAYVNMKIRPGFNLLLIRSFYNIIRKERPDVVHCHQNLVIYFFILSILYSKRIRFIYTLHNSAQKEVKSKIERLIRRFFFKRNLIIPVAISDQTKSSYESYYRLHNAPVIYNGRSIPQKSAKFEGILREIHALKPTLGTLLFCHIGQYHEQKNQKMLISVFKKLIDEGYDVALTIIGSGFENASELKEIANNFTHFLGVRNNIADYLYASDAFCLSSRYEGMPITLIEAFACGCVPICTPVGGIVDVIEEGVTGFISESVGESDYYKAIKKFINQGKEIDRNRLVNYYHENLGIEKCAREYIKLYK